MALALRLVHNEIIVIIDYYWYAEKEAMHAMI
jgi:hypothetical protein